jgi:hypothetical protein
MNKGTKLVLLMKKKGKKSRASVPLSDPDCPPPASDPSFQVGHLSVYQLFWGLVLESKY